VDCSRVNFTLPIPLLILEHEFENKKYETDEVYGHDKTSFAHVTPDVQTSLL